jgi:hypothetical protein
MSVINWSAEELGNVARYLGGTGAPLREMAVQLAVVSRANVEEFIATYQDRHGTPVPHTADEIAAAAPLATDAEDALSTLGLLGYNAHATTPALRVEVARAIAIMGPA